MSRQEEKMRLLPGQQMLFRMCEGWYYLRPHACNQIQTEKEEDEVSLVQVSIA